MWLVKQLENIEVNIYPNKVILPEGCVGVCFIFLTKKSAYDWCETKNITFEKIEIVEKED